MGMYGGEPEAPAPPDYAAANREGIYADIETLPIRRLLDYASRAGESVKYVKPGAEQRKIEVEKQQAEWDDRFQKSTTPSAISQFASALGVKTPTQAELLANHVAAYGARPVLGEDDYITADFTGKGDIDLSRLQTKLRGETADLEAANQLGIAQKYGADFQQVALDALKRQDPAGYAGRQELAAGLRSDYATPTNVSESERSQLLRDAAIGQSLERRSGQGGPTVLSQLANLTALGQAGEGQGASAETELSRLVRSAGIGLAGRGDDYGLAGSAGSQQARNAALQGGIAEYSLGGQLSGEQQRGIEQSVRGAAAARGQALSSSGAIKEILGKYNMGEQLKQQRLQNLLSVGAQAFGQEQAAGQSQAQLAQTRLASLFGAQQAEYGQGQASRGMTNQEQQQRLQNLFGAQQTEFGQEQSIRGTREQEAQQRLQNLFAAQQNQFGQEQSLRQETQQQQQRRLSNLQSYVLGAPISSSFQSLQGAQQGASPYAPIMAQGIGQNANAGQQAASFAGNIFGTQANMYGTQVGQANAQSEGTGSMVGAGVSLAIAL